MRSEHFHTVTVTAAAHPSFLATNRALEIAIGQRCHRLRLLELCSGTTHGKNYTRTQPQTPRYKQNLDLILKYGVQRPAHTGNT